MANVEIWKNGQLLSRRAVDDASAAKGYWVTLKTGDRVLLKTGEAAELHGYRIRIVEEERHSAAAEPDREDEADLLQAMARAVKQERTDGSPSRPAEASPTAWRGTNAASGPFLGLRRPLWGWLLAGGGLVAAILLTVVLVAVNRTGDRSADVAPQKVAPKPPEGPPMDEKLVATATEKLSGAVELYNLAMNPVNDRVEDRGGKKLSEMRDQLSKAMSEVTETDRLMAPRPPGWNNHPGFVKAVNGVQRAKELIPPLLAKVESLLWPGPGGVSQMFPEVSRAVPLVEAIGRGSGSGFLVRHGSLYLVTNKHVVKGAREGFRLHFPLGDPSHPEDVVVEVPSAAVEIVHATSDLALINLTAAAKKEARLNQVHPLALATYRDEPKTADPIWIVGHPGLMAGSRPDLPNACNQGTVTNRAFLPPFGDCLQYDAAANPGNSGGPLLDRYGRVIGIVAIGMKDKALMNFALYVETLQKLLDAPEANGLAKDRIAGLLGPSGASEAALRAKYAQLLAANGNVKPYDWDDGGGAARFCILGEEPALLKVNVEPGKRYMILAVAERNLALAVAVVSGAPEVDPSPAKVVAVGHKSTGAERFSLSFSAQTAGIHVMTIRKEAGDELSPLVIGVVREK